MAAIIAFALAHIRGLLIVVALGIAVATVVGLKHGYDEGKRDEGRAEVRAKELKPLQDQVEAAQKRATEMTLAWDEKRKAADQLAQERDDAIAEKLAAAKRAAATLPPAVAGLIFPRDAAVLLNQPSVSRPAQPAGTPPAPGRASAAAARPADAARR